jgi:hypothetical protein
MKWIINPSCPLWRMNTVVHLCMGIPCCATVGVSCLRDAVFVTEHVMCLLEAECSVCLIVCRFQ